MKILRITPAPASLIKFRINNNLKHKLFNEQVEILREGNMILPGSWAKEMTAHGFEVMDILYPDVALLAKWARENGFNDLAINPDPFKILEKIIKSFKPNIVYIFAGALFWIDRSKREKIRNLMKGFDIKFVGYWGDELHKDLYDYKNYFGDLDYVFTSSDKYSQYFTESNIYNKNIGNCFEPNHNYKKTPNKEKDIDILFCGTTGYGIPEHFNRYKTLSNLLRDRNIKIYGDDRLDWIGRSRFELFKILEIIPKSLIDFLRKNTFIKKLFKSKIWILDDLYTSHGTGVGPFIKYTRPTAHPNIGIYDHLYPLRKKYKSKFENSLTNYDEYLSLLSRAKIVLNIHRDEDADVGNIRCYEATGVGSCLLTDRAHLLSPDRFIDGKEIMGFTNYSDLLEKIDLLLGDEALRNSVALAGYERCSAEHLTRNRCDATAKIFKSLLIKNSVKASKERVLIGKYDTQGQPISFDFAFFLQNLEIVRLKNNIKKVIVSIISPEDIHNQPGVSKEVDLVVNGDSRKFRMSHILLQLASLMENYDVYFSPNRFVDPYEIGLNNADIIQYPDATLGIPHHCTYFQAVNSSNSFSGFSASKGAISLVSSVLASQAGGRKIVTLSLRQYNVDTKRNSNINDWGKFLGELDADEFFIVIVPDTDEIAQCHQSILNKYFILDIAAVDVDLRFALYEMAYINLFINTGPCIAATLDRKIHYLLFKIAVRGIATTELDFIKLLGFEVNKTPNYAGNYQKWVWKDDEYSVIKEEFFKLNQKLTHDGVK